MPRNHFAGTFKRCHEILLPVLLEDAMECFCWHFLKCHEKILPALLKDGMESFVWHF
jgi:hypothetical protein